MNRPEKVGVVLHAVGELAALFFATLAYFEREYDLVTMWLVALIVLKISNPKLNQLSLTRDTMRTPTDRVTDRHRTKGTT